MWLFEVRERRLFGRRRDWVERGSWSEEMMLLWGLEERRMALWLKGKSWLLKRLSWVKLSESIIARLRSMPLNQSS